VGFELYARHGCAACHGGPAPSDPAPALDVAGALRPPRAIAELLDAHEPALFAGLDARERDETRLALTHFLVARGGPVLADDRAPAGVDAATLERGRQLYHSVGCVACHAPYEDAATLARPLWDFPEVFEAHAVAASDSVRNPEALPDVTRRWTLASLASYLADPVRLHRDGRMPSLALTAAEAEDLAAYLWFEARVDGGAHLALAPGLALEYFESSFGDDTADFDALVPVRRAVVTSFFADLEHRDDDFGLRFRGLVDVPATGEYVFHTTSDDGSMLSIDGRLVVDNRGQHPLEERSGAVHLDAGRHALEVTYFEHMGGDGLEVRWEGPGFPKRELGFDVLTHVRADLGAPSRGLPIDPALARRGRDHVDRLGCAACHAPEGVVAPSAPPLAELDAARGCLDERSEGAHPHFSLSSGERASLAAAVRSRTTPPPPNACERLAHELSRLGCGACHVRGAELAGPDDERRSYFQVERGLDLGDEGRLPPSLDGAGGKLRPAWLASVLTGDGRARPYMKTRMPRFGAENVAELPALFAECDAAQRDEREPAFSVDAVASGRELAGTGGLGCIQCHELAGHPSIGIPAVDLAHVTERLYPGWFRSLLMDPVALKMNTRMPAFWVDGKSPVKTLYDGDPSAQVDALWSYLSLGSSMPLPRGLVPLPGEYEVEVTDEPVCVGVFMEGVGPRTVCVGLPERVHYAFDVEHSRLALAWRGRFLDARGTWHGRAGQLEKPAGEDVLEFPPGEALMMLDERDDAWPAEVGRAAGYHVLGRSVGVSRRPEFRYSVCGVEVGETMEPVIRAGGSGLRRRFSMPLDQVQGNLFLRAAVGDSVQRVGEGSWSIERDGATVRVQLPTDAGFVHADESGRAELRFPIVSDSVSSTPSARPIRGASLSWAVYEVEYSW